MRSAFFSNIPSLACSSSLHIAFFIALLVAEIQQTYSARNKLTLTGTDSRRQEHTHAARNRSAQEQSLKPISFNRNPGRCPALHFLDRHRKCRPCRTKCPDNQLLLSSFCSPFTNSKCIRLSELLRKTWIDHQQAGIKVLPSPSLVSEVVKDAKRPSSEVQAATARRLELEELVYCLLAVCAVLTLLLASTIIFLLRRRLANLVRRSAISRRLGSTEEKLPETITYYYPRLSGIACGAHSDDPIRDAPVRDAQDHYSSRRSNLPQPPPSTSNQSHSERRFGSYVVVRDAVCSQSDNWWSRLSSLLKNEDRSPTEQITRSAVAGVHRVYQNQPDLLPK